MIGVLKSDYPGTVCYSLRQFHGYLRSFRSRIGKVYRVQRGRKMRRQKCSILYLRRLDEFAVNQHVEKGICLVFDRFYNLRVPVAGIANTYSTNQIDILLTTRV